MNLPRRPVLMTIGLPHFSQVSPASSTLFSGLSRLAVVLHFGYAEHDRNFPRGPVRISICSPQVGHLCSLGCGSSGALPLSGLVLRHSGKPLHARNLPVLLTRMSIGLPHFSQTSSVCSTA